MTRAEELEEKLFTKAGRLKEETQRIQVIQQAINEETERCAGIVEEFRFCGGKAANMMPVQAQIASAIRGKNDGAKKL